MMAIGALCAKYDGIDALRGIKEQSDRQFTLEDVDPSDSKAYQYYITVGPGRLEVRRRAFRSPGESVLLTCIFLDMGKDLHL
jgi:hypothetical protein